MRYEVRTAEGELGFPSLDEVGRAFAAGLVGPEDELREAGGSWRPVRAWPAVTRFHATRPGSRRAQAVPVLIAVALAAGAFACLFFTSGWLGWTAGLVLAFGAGSLLTRITLRALPPSSLGRRR